jgi:hypothetical protein
VKRLTLGQFQPSDHELEPLGDIGRTALLNFSARHRGAGMPRIENGSTFAVDFADAQGYAGFGLKAPNTNSKSAQLASRAPVRAELSTGASNRRRLSLVTPAVENEDKRMVEELDEYSSP